MKTRAFAAAALLLALALPGRASSKNEDAWTLRYALPEGQSFTLELERWQKNDRTFMGNRLVDESRYGTRDTFTVLDRDRQGLRLEIAYGVRWMLDLGDSGGQNPDLSALEGERARFRLSASGERSGFEGFETLPVIRIPSKGDELNAERYKLELLSLFPRLPDGPVRTGDTWTAREAFQDPNAGSPLDVELDYTYTCTGRNSGEPPELIGVDARFTVRVNGTVDAGGLLLELDMNGEGRDRFLFDTARGMVAGHEGTMWVEGKALNAEMEIEAPIRNDYKTEFSVEFDD